MPATMWLPHAGPRPRWLCAALAVRSGLSLPLQPAGAYCVVNCVV